MANITMGSTAPSCDTYLLFYGETLLPNGVRAFVYTVALAYCFIGLSAITARFFKSMESIMKHSREVVTTDPHTNMSIVKHEKVWNYTIADIVLLAFGTSFPQISLATIDAIRNLGQLTAGGLGPGTLVGSAAFDLFPIHAVCVVMPRAGSMKKISDLGVWLVELFWSFWAYIWLYVILEVWTPRVITLWEALLTVLQYGLLLLHAYAQDKRWPYVSIPLVRGERPEEWVPAEDASVDYDNNCDEITEMHPGQNEDIVDIFTVHSYNNAEYHHVPEQDMEESSMDTCWLSIWWQQFVDAVTLENPESRKMDSICLRFIRIFWNSIVAPWKLFFAFVPPYQIAHGWIAFICSLTFISGIAYGVTKLTDQISCVTGVSPYVIAFTALAAGTSWPDLVASKIAAERQVTADSAIANITCSNSVNIYVGIGVPWLIDTVYNFFVYQKPLYIDNAAGLSFSLLVFFATSFGCITILVLRRIVLGAELGGPRLWAWATSMVHYVLSRPDRMDGWPYKLWEMRRYLGSREHCSPVFHAVSRTRGEQLYEWKAWVVLTPLPVRPDQERKFIARRMDRDDAVQDAAQKAAFYLRDYYSLELSYTPFDLVPQQRREGLAVPQFGEDDDPRLAGIAVLWAQQVVRYDSTVEESRRLQRQLWRTREQVRQLRASLRRFEEIEALDHVEEPSVQSSCSTVQSRRRRRLMTTVEYRARFRPAAPLALPAPGDDEE